MSPAGSRQRGPTAALGSRDGAIAVMHTMAGFVALGMLLLGGCPDAAHQPTRSSDGAAPAPRSFAERAPKETRLLGWLDVGRLRALAQDDGPLARLGRRWRSCGGGARSPDGRLDVAVGGAGQVRLEVKGTAQLKPLGCLLGDLTLPGGLGAAAAPGGGLRVALPGAMAEGAGAPAALRARLNQAPVGAAAALATRLGNGSRSIDLLAWVGRGGVELRIRFARREWFRHARQVLERLIRNLDPRGDRYLLGAVGSELRLKVPRLGTLLPLLREGVVSSFRIGDEGMVPTLHAGEVAELRRGPLAPAVERGDVVVVSQGGEALARRVVAMGGDRVGLRGGRLWVNGHPVPAMRIDAGYRWDEAVEGGWRPQRAERWRENLDGSVYHTVRVGSGAGGQTTGALEKEEVRVPRGQLFLLADNRNRGRDSRHFGPVSRGKVLGRIARIWWSEGPAGLRWERIARLIR